MQNQTFSEMMKAAMIPLEGRSPEDIARRTGFDYDGEGFSFRSLGMEITLGWPGCSCTPGVQPWHQLVMLHYMDHAADMPLTGRLIPFGAQSGGMIRGGGFDRDCEETIRRVLGKCDPALLEHACRQMGARLLPSNADLCAEFAFLPRYPVTLKIWFADDEMDASGRMFLDAGAEHHLGVEDSVTVGILILEHLQQLIQQEETK